MWGVRYANRLTIYMKTTECFELQAMRSIGILAMLCWTMASKDERLALLSLDEGRVYATSVENYVRRNRQLEESRC